MSTSQQLSARPQAAGRSSASSRGAAPAADKHEGAENRIHTVRQLISAMLIGEMNRKGDEAQIIFKAASQALGDGRQLRISLTLASAMRGDAKPALELLAENLDDWPHPDMARVALAMSLKVAGQPQWRDVPDRVLSVSTDESVRLFAQLVIAS
jgi:hypothetical protein